MKGKEVRSIKRKTNAFCLNLKKFLNQLANAVLLKALGAQDWHHFFDFRIL